MEDKFKRLQLHTNYAEYWRKEHCNDEAIDYCMESCGRTFSEDERKTILKSMEEYHNDDADSYYILGCDGTFSEDEARIIHTYIEECYDQTKEAIVYYTLSSNGTLSEDEIETILNSQKYNIYYNVLNLESWLHRYVVNCWNRLSNDEKEEYASEDNIDDARWKYCVSLSEEMLKNLVYSKKNKIVIIIG